MTIYYLAEYQTHRFGTFQAIAADYNDSLNLLVQGLRQYAADWGLDNWIDFNSITVKSFPSNAILRDDLERIEITSAGVTHV